MPKKHYPALALAILTGLNLFNYIDRYVLAAVQPLIQAEFHRSDAEIGWLTGAFFLFYMVTAPFIGVLADRYSRKALVVGGAIIWSGATLLTAFTHNYSSLLIRHTIVGIGEASFVTIAPSLIADLFPENFRGRMLSILYLAIPVGAAGGYLLGGALAPRYGWRAPFYAAALPGFILALLFLAVPEPERGHSDLLRATPERATLTGLKHNPGYWAASLGMAAMTFAQGGLAVWMPTFLSRVRGMPLNSANQFFGILTLFDGITATLIGGWLGDKLLRRNRGAYYMVSGIGMIIAVPFMVIAVFNGGRAMYPAMWLAVFFILLNTGPLNAALVNSVAAPIRSTAIALNLFTIHLLGDVPSPPLMGFISDHSSLQLAFIPAIVAAAVAGIIMLYGTRFAPQIPARNKSGLITHREAAT